MQDDDFSLFQSAVRGVKPISHDRADTGKPKADRQRIIDSGRSQLITLSSEEREAWRDAMRPVWQQFESVIGSDVIKAAQTVNRKQRN